MYSFADYDQNLNKLGQALLILKCGSPRAADDIKKLREISRHVLANEDCGNCIFREHSPLRQSYGDLFLHRNPFGFMMYSRCDDVEDVKKAIEEFNRAKSFTTDSSCIYRHIINVIGAEATSVRGFESNSEITFIKVELEKEYSIAVNSLITDVNALVKSLFAERKLIAVDDFVAIDKTLRLSQLEDKSDAKKRKLTSGRWLKHLGDLSFCCGNLIEAENYYIKAIELLKTSIDPWLAAAKEAAVAVGLIITAKMRFLPDNGAMSNVSPKQLGSFSAMIEDALNIYMNYRNCQALYLESLLRAVHFYQITNQRCNVAKALQTFAAFDLGGLHGARGTVEDDHVTRHVKCAKVYDIMGWHRKAAFSYRLAAMQSVTEVTNSSQWVSCHNLLMKAVRGYGLTNISVNDNHSSTFGGFIHLQARLLMDLFAASMAFNNYPLALRHACHALDIGGHTLFSYQLSQIFGDMAKLSAYATSLDCPLVIDPDTVLLPVNSAPYPRLHGAYFHSETLELSSSVIRPSTSSASASKSSFIYSPFSHPEKNYSLSTCVCLGEDIKVVLEMENTFSVPLKLDYLKLTDSQKSDLVDYACVVDEILFPSSSKSIVLKCRTKSAGVLLITGCEVSICGIVRKIIFAEVLAVMSKSQKNKSTFEVEILPIKLPFLTTPSCNADTPVLYAFLGEVMECQILAENRNSDVLPAIIDLTLKGVPPSVEKSLAVTFISDSVINIRVDGTSLPCRFSSTFDVSAKFVYSSLSSRENLTTSPHLRSFTFNFRIVIASLINGTVVSIERYNRDEIVFDVKFEHVGSDIYAMNPIEVSLLNDEKNNVSPSILQCGEKRHIHCCVSNNLVSTLIPEDNKSLKSLDNLDISQILNFQWRQFNHEPPYSSVLRRGKCLVMVCGSNLISRLRLPPFNTSVQWWKTDSNRLSSSHYDVSSPIDVKLAEPFTLSVTIQANSSMVNAAIHLHIEKEIARCNPSSPIFISGLRSCNPQTLSPDDTLTHKFSVISAATGRYRIRCDVVDSSDLWPSCPTIFINCSE